MPARPIDLSILKEGLEYASFSDFRIRDAINKVIHELQNDLDDVGFEPGPIVIEAIKELEELYLELQTANVKTKERRSIKLATDDVIEEHPKRRESDNIEEFISDEIEHRPKSGLKVVDPK